MHRPRPRPRPPRQLQVRQINRSFLIVFLCFRRLLKKLAWFALFSFLVVPPHQIPPPVAAALECYEGPGAVVARLFLFPMYRALPGASRSGQSPARNSDDWRLADRHLQGEAARTDCATTCVDPFLYPQTPSPPSSPSLKHTHTHTLSLSLSFLG